MTERRPLVMVAGEIRELPLADSLPARIAPVVTLDNSATTVPVDLATGSLFEIEAGLALHSFELLNPTEGQEVRLILRGKAIGTPYDLTALTSAGNGYLSLPGACHAMEFAPDGTRIFVNNGANATWFRVREYTLSTPWDLSTASFVTEHLLGNSGDPPSPSFCIADGGTRAYFLRDNTYVTSFTLATPYAFQTAGNRYASGHVDNGGQIRVVDAGTRMILGPESGYSFKYGTMTTPHDISTYTQWGTAYVPAMDSDYGVWGFDFNADGSKLFLVGRDQDHVARHALATPWDISTASYDGISASVAAQVTNCRGLVFGKEGEKLYIGQATSASETRWFEYDVFGSPAPASFLYPASVEWPAGTPPASPGVDELDVIRLLCVDAVTPRYLAWQDGDALA